MDRDEMTNEENYALDISGCLHVSNVLTKAEVTRLKDTIGAAGKLEGMLGWEPAHRDPFRELLIQPQLVWYLNQIIGRVFC